MRAELRLFFFALVHAQTTQMGYILFLNSNYSFKHTIGNRISYRILNTNLRSGNHSPDRRKMIMLNSILILRKHVRRFPVLFYIISERILYELLGIVFAEKNKLVKLRSSFRGIVNGLFLKIS
jgi:hypothetical protein